MTISNDEKVLISNLINSLNDMIDGKFILADSKISRILKDIAESRELITLLTECMSNFDFEREFIRAKIKTPTKPGYFKLPTEKYKLLPIVFCLLVDIERRNIDFPIFLRDYFRGSDPSGMEFKNFGKEVIKPFRNAISEIFDLPLTINERITKFNNESKIIVPSKVETKVIQNEKSEDVMEEEKDIETELRTTLNEMIATAKADNRLDANLRDEFLIVCEGIKKSIDVKEYKIMSALVVSLEYITPRIKSMRFLYRELKDVLFDFYNYEETL